jgi:hypothetical protein
MFAGKRASQHVLRRTAEMELLGHGVDRVVIALRLVMKSVETTQMYLHADMRFKEQALARATPPDVKPGRYRPRINCSRFSNAPDYADEATWKREIFAAALRRAQRSRHNHALGMMPLLRAA